MTSVSAPNKGRGPQVPNGNPFLDAMMAGEGGAGGGMDIGALMGMMGGAGGAGGAPGGMDMSALMGMMGGAGGGGAGGGGPGGGGMDIGALMGMMGGAGGAGGAPGAGGRGVGGGGGQMDMLTKILPYVPKILAVVAKLPSFLCGYCVGLAVLLLIHFVDPVSILGLNTIDGGAITATTSTTGVVDEMILLDSDDMLSAGLTDDLVSGGVGSGPGAAMGTGFTYFAPQAGFYVVFLVLISLVLPLFRRAKAIIEGATYDVIRADSIAKEAKRKVAMKEHNAELD